MTGTKKKSANFGEKWYSPPLIATPGKGLVKLFPIIVIR